MINFIGKPVSRVDGRLKVTGGAVFSAEFNCPGLAHAVVVRSTIASGRITAIAVDEADRAPGVIAVLTHQNSPRLPYHPHKSLPDAVVGERLHVLQDDHISHQGQPVALIIAETLEEAAHAVSLVRVSYAPDAGTTDYLSVTPVDPTDEKAAVTGLRREESQRGNPAEVFATAEVSFDGNYSIPREYHNPIETHATIASWDGDQLTLWDKTQWVHNVADEIAAIFGMPARDIHVISPFVGGAFGSAARVWAHVTLAALGARIVGRPVKLVLTRRDMYYGTGYRPRSTQRVAIGASLEGRLQSISHEVSHETSTYEEYMESLLFATRFLHSCPNVYTRYHLAPMNIHTPTYMRGPGEASGLFALESALDELAANLKIDPVELRLRNEPAIDESTNLPFSSRSTRECYLLATERFGWSKRNPEPRSMRDGRLLVGWGMATGVYPVYVATASARVRIFPNGTAEVVSAASDMGPGTYTSMTQVAAETLGLSLDQITFKLGDTNLPRAAIHAGSMTMSSVGSAIQAACDMARAEALLQTGASNLKEALRHLKGPIEKLADFSPEGGEQKFSMNAFSAVFAEVTVDPELGETRVRRMVGVYGAGRIVNPKIARSQCVGGMIGGIGMALMEHAIVDPRSGRVVNANLAEYAVPVHADAPPLIDVIFVDEKDPYVPMGVKGIGELAMAGIAPAISNAVFHATGRRVRSLPITPDKLL
ncbi:xanthine dehydrogenase family protein molybdopterin-binding subunit [Rhizobium leguminosarum]|uniref:xanthine dehydrogenase family protein molybdopterin-binding subunit n=1 Tax=Rhizobium leguminosarum TaxID=384 RepID=UPI003ED14D56